MTTKTQTRIKMALYVLVLILAELLQTSVFGTLALGVIPCVIPVAVGCISVCEGPERGGIFGLVGGCLWAWSTQLSFFGAFAILLLTAAGIAGGFVTERFLLPGIKTALAVSAGALVLTDGVFTLSQILTGRVPAWALVGVFLPGALIALALCLILYPLTARIARIGGPHG